jgi:acyl-CoA reductase-like NAD-dependent aldehyde dehydrogenase
MAADSSYTVPLWIGGKEVVTATTFPVISPATHNQIWLSSSASISDVDDAIAAAKAAFPAWTKTKPVARRNILLKAAEVLERRAEELGEYMMQETGANRGFAAESNVPLATELVRDVAGRLSGIMGSIPVCREEGTAALVVKEAFGVVLGIAPW